MFRFARYAWRFERAYRSDAWGAVRDCFHGDATYTMTGGAPFDGVIRGADAIVEHFRRVLADFDRRFDRRIPRVGWPRVGLQTLWFPWQVRYVLGDESFVLRGKTTCVYRGWRIQALTDDMDPRDCGRALEFSTRFKAPVAAGHPR